MILDHILGQVSRLRRFNDSSWRERFVVKEICGNGKTGCFRQGTSIKEAWVRVVGLPLHMWSREVFKKIGNGCRAFIAVDEDTAFFTKLQ